MGAPAPGESGGVRGLPLPRPKGLRNAAPLVESERDAMWPWRSVGTGPGDSAALPWNLRGRGLPPPTPVRGAPGAPLGSPDSVSLRFFLPRCSHPRVWPSSCENLGRQGGQRGEVALAGEREDQRETRVRRLPRHTAVGADCRPLYFKVRSDK